jgi:syntaxin 1B/2/3
LVDFIVKPDATQDEVDDIIDSDGPPQVFAQSVIAMMVY